LIKNVLTINNDVKLTINHFKNTFDNNDVISFGYLLNIIDLTNSANQQLLDDIINLDKKKIAKLIIDYLLSKKKLINQQKIFMIT
jgi:hypothetical protein